METGFDIEDMLVDVFQWFDKSNKRKSTLEEFREFMEQEYKNIIKYVFTRRLSLESPDTRCLKLFKIVSFIELLLFISRQKRESEI